MRWLQDGDRPVDLALGPVAWLFRDDDAAALATASRAGATEADLADAARARAHGGAPRLLRRRVLRALAAEALGLHPASLVFERDVRGAVRLAAGAEAFVSTAGRAGWSAVALGPRPVGVDVEVTDALPTSELRAWLRREAWGKACGRGLDHDEGEPPACAFRVRGPVTACVLELRPPD